MAVPITTKVLFTGNKLSLSAKISAESFMGTLILEQSLTLKFILIHFRKKRIFAVIQYNGDAALKHNKLLEITENALAHTTAQCTKLTTLTSTPVICTYFNFHVHAWHTRGTFFLL